MGFCNGPGVTCLQLLCYAILGYTCMSCALALAATVQQALGH